MKRVYLDSAAATPIDPRVRSAMIKAAHYSGNPSSVTTEGIEAAEFLALCRKRAATMLHASASELVFTASGSEANTLAIFGVLAALKPGAWNIITAPTEHKSVLEAVKQAGAEVRMLTVDEWGNVDLKQLESLIDGRTALVSLMYANNEIGTIHPVSQIAQIVRAARKRQRTTWPYLHTDACQATAWLPMNVQSLGVDLLSLNGAKMYGPRTGVLFVRHGVPLLPRVLGGDQEHGLRAGTEDLVSIAGLAQALELIHARDAKKVAHLRDYAWQQIQKTLPQARLNGPDLADRLANNLNVSFPDVESEPLILELDARGIAASAGSACTAKSTGASHVLTAIRVPPRYRAGAIRFSLSRHTTKKEIDTLVKILPQAVQRVINRK